MASAISQYLRTLCDRFGDGWNRFWFTPSDPCVLGPIRLLTGLVVLYLHVTLTPDLVRFFGAGGWLPLAAVNQLDGGANPDSILNGLATFSYLNYLSTPGELLTAHTIAGMILFCFTVGLFTRVTSILSFIVLVSEVHRAPLITSQVEPIASFLILYLCVGPAGACCSLDALLRRSRAPSAQSLLKNASGLSTAATISVRLMQVHVVLVYAVLALSQLTGDTWWLGTGMWWLMTRTESRLVDFTWLSGYLIQLWSYAQWMFELAFALLVWNSLARPLLVALSLVMWPLLALVTGLTSFCLIMMIASLAFVPSAALRSCCASAKPKLA